MSKHSQACCELPPVISHGYQTKGEYKTLNGLKTYVTGAANATRAILVIYDIFGFQDQTLQGADILAHSRTDSEGSGEGSFQVFMPDFLDGDYIPLSEYPPKTDEQKKKMGEWFGTTANPEKAQKRIPDCIKAAQEQVNPKIKSWGGLGFCWGGKMISLSAAGQSPMFKAVAQSSPAMVDPADALKISIPMCMLASKDEPQHDVAKYRDSLQGKKHVETFHSQLHGFMSARGDLKDESVVKEYRRGYETVLQFFQEHL